MITFRNVKFQYRDRIVLNDLSLVLPEGSFHFLIGPSGSGKSTFLNLCSYNLFPTQGTVEIFGEITTHADRDDVAIKRRDIGMLPQSTHFVDHINVYDNVMLPAIAAGLNPNDERKNVLDLLNWVGLGDRLESFPQELSGGQQQRVALARAIIMSPDIILADEPTGNVDWEMGQRIMQLLMQLNALGKTIIIATHDLNLIRSAKGRVKTRILRLKDGEIEIAGSDL